MKLVWSMSVVLVLAVVFNFVIPVTALTPEVQVDALKAFYRSTGGIGWRKSTNWMNGDPCENHWYGVTCDGDDNVIKLGITYGSISGTFPPSFWSITTLQEMDFGGNGLGGTISGDIAKMTNLTILELDSNSLSGQLPETFSKMKNLTTVRLEYNSFSGSVPSSLLYLKNLQTLNLKDNNLEKANFTNLRMKGPGTTLDLSGNVIKATLTPEIYRIDDLELHGNNLMSELPDPYDDDQNFIRTLQFNNARLNGTVPSSIVRCKSLHTIYLNNNQMFGVLPEQMATLPNLTQLYFSNTKLYCPKNQQWKQWAKHANSDCQAYFQGQVNDPPVFAPVITYALALPAIVVIVSIISAAVAWHRS